MRRTQHTAERNGRTAPVALLNELSAGADAYRAALDERERLTRERVVDAPQEARRSLRQRVRLRRS